MFLRPLGKAKSLLADDSNAALDVAGAGYQQSRGASARKRRYNSDLGCVFLIRVIGFLTGLQKLLAHASEVG
jgi:hypothetical protein